MKKKSSNKPRKAASTKDKALITIDSPELLAHVTAIRQLGKQTITSVISIGEHLIECKKIVGHGGFGDFLKREFLWKESTALRFMRVSSLAGESAKLTNLNVPASSLYLLAAPNTPLEVRKEIIARAEKGEKIKHDTVVAAVKAAKPAKTKVVKTNKTNGAAPTTDAAAIVRETQARAAQALPGSIGPVFEEKKLGDNGARVRDLERLNGALTSEVEELKAEVENLKAEIEAKDVEIARLKGKPPTPPSKPKPTAPLSSRVEPGAGAAFPDLPAYLDRNVP
jgi:hypothetical protein